MWYFDRTTCEKPSQREKLWNLPGTKTLFTNILAYTKYRCRFLTCYKPVGRCCAPNPLRDDETSTTFKNYSILFDGERFKCDLTVKRTRLCYLSDRLGVMLLCWYDCDDTQCHYDFTQFQYVLWCHTMYECIIFNRKTEWVKGDSNNETHTHKRMNHMKACVMLFECWLLRFPKYQEINSMS